MRSWSYKQTDTDTILGVHFLACHSIFEYISAYAEVKPIRSYVAILYFQRRIYLFRFTYPTVSCLDVTGMTPARLVNPTVGLIPTTEFSDAGHSMEPSVSVPSVTAAMPVAAAIADPVLEPHGSADSTYGFYTKTRTSVLARCNLSPLTQRKSETDEINLPWPGRRARSSRCRRRGGCGSWPTRPCSPCRAPRRRRAGAGTRLRRHAAAQSPAARTSRPSC